MQFIYKIFQKSFMSLKTQIFEIKTVAWEKVAKKFIKKNQLKIFE